MRIIDIHSHGINGLDTRTASGEDILKIAEAQGNYGVSEFVPTVYPSTIDSMRENMMAIKEAMDIQKAEWERRLTEAKIIGVHLEGPFINPARCGALDAASMLTPDEVNLERLIDGFEGIIKIITIAPELPGAVNVIKKMSGLGIIASMGHSDAAYSEAEAGFRAGASGITHIFNAMRGIHHREPGIAGFGLMNSDIYIEVIADPFHLSAQMIELVFSMKAPDRIIIVSDTVKASKVTPASYGIRDENNRLLGGSYTIKESAERLIDNGLDRDIVYHAISVNPERYLH